MIASLTYRAGRGMRRLAWRTFVRLNRGRWRQEATDHRRAFILFTARTGSKVLVSYLRSLADVEFQYEVLNPNYTRKRSALAKLAGPAASRFESADDAHLFVAANVTNSSGIAGAKILLTQPERSGTTIEQFCEHFSDAHFLVLYRANLVEQFVSLRTARATGEWGHFTRDGDVRRERTQVEFDRADFSAFAESTREAYDRAITALTRVESRFLTISYESLCEAEPASLRQSLAEFLGTPLGSDDVTFDTTKQAKGPVTDSVSNPGVLTAVMEEDNYLLELGERVVHA